jgi:UDP-N-acetylmuramyl pentapeptide phosphotransferase/UDP-N-acetylglucosamine-1-phosphate transferase
MVLLSIFEKYPYLITFLTFLLGAVLMPFVIRFARKKNLVVGTNKRTSHNGIVPNTGGLLIFLCMMFVFVILLIINAISIYIVIGFTVMFVIGFIDDKLELSAMWKLLGETLGVFFLIYFADIRIETLNGILGIEQLPLWASYLISFICFIIIVNALNLIDGIDGLASGLGIIYASFFGVWFICVNDSYVAIISFAIIGALSIFFIYNVFGGNKRKVFMGDSGSLSLGYLITFFTYTFIRDNQIGNYQFLYPAVTALIVLFVPVFDMARVALTRIKNHKSIFMPDKNHIHHLLLKIGTTHKKVTMLLIVFSLLFIGLALLLQKENYLIQISLITLISVILVFLLWRLVDNKAK